VSLVPAFARQTRPELVAFASWLRSRMRARRMTTSALAQRIASSSSGVSEWMRAIRQPRLETLRRLAEEFATPLEELEAMLPDPQAAPLVPEADVDRARVILAAEGYGGMRYIPVETADLTDYTPPVAPGMVVWVAPMIAPIPGKVIAVEFGGQLLLRVLAADGATLHSAIAPPLRLADADRVVGVGLLAQVPL
jgi:transcriptional regulator with XRE-family HTH domain